MLLVSHDRYFLDRVTNRTLELFQGTVDSYTGNFSAYWTQKAERLLVSQRTYEKQQIEIEKAKEFIRRNHYGQKHQQAEDRRKKLERIELVAVPRTIVQPPMGFPPAARCGDIVVRAEGLAKAFERPLFADVDLQIVRGERWGLIGPNGCGKSTLLRCLLGEQPPDAGTVQIGAGVSIGYFDQHLTGVSDDDDVVDSIRPKHKQFLTAAAPRPAGPLRHIGRHAIAKGGQAQRRRAEPRRPGAAGRGRRQFPGAGRADEPSRPLGPRRLGAGARRLRRHRALRQPRPLLRQPRRRPPDRLRAGPRSGYRGQLRSLSALLEEQGRRRSCTVASRGRAQGCRARGQSAKASNMPSNTPAQCGVATGTCRGTTTATRSAISPIASCPTSRPTSSSASRGSSNSPRNWADQATFRDGGRVRAIKQELAEQQSALKKLYEHWEEASEMNW